MLNLLSPQLRRYGVAGLTVILALLLKLLLEFQIEVENSFLLFFPAVMFSSWYGGLGPGVFATILTVSLSYYFFLDPNYSLLFSHIGQSLSAEPPVEQTLHWMLNPNQNLQLGLFVLQVVLFIWLTGVFRVPKRAFGRLAGNKEELFVQERSLPIVEKAQTEQPVNIVQNLNYGFASDDRQVINILESITDAFFALDQQWRFTYINRRCAEFLGHSPEEFLGKCAWDVFPEAIGTVAYDQFHRAVQEQIAVHLEIPGLYTERWYEAHVYPWAEGLAVYFQEITDRKKAEKALRQSEERFRVALKNSPIIVFNQDRNLRYTWLHNLHPSYSIESLIGKTDWDIAPDDVAVRLTQTKQQVLESGVGAREEIQISINGVLCTYDLTIEPLYSEVGEIVGIVGAAVNISERQAALRERKQAQAALKESEERFRVMFDQAAVGIALVALEGRFIQVNPALCDITGYSRDELLQLSVQDISHPDEQKLDADNVQRVLAREIDGYSVEKRYFRKDGSIVWVNVTVSLVWDSEGQPKYGVGIIEDISERQAALRERKLAQAALKESEERFRAMFNQAAVGIVQAGLDGRFIQVNPAMCEITGYTHEELTQMTFQELTHPEDLDADLANVQQVLSGEINGYSLEKRYIRKDGSVVWINLCSSVVRNSQGKPKYGVGIIEDISDRKYAEATQQFLVEASTLLAASLDYETTLSNVAHLAVPTLADWCIVDVFQADASVRQIAIACADPSKQATLEELRRRYPPDPKTQNSAWQGLLQGQSILYSEFTDSQMVATAKDEEHLQLLRRLGRRSVMVVPIKSRQQVLGVISFALSESGRHYNPADLALAEDIARRAASAIDNARLYRDSEAARTSAQEANRMKDEFLAILSHELRSPLNAILGWTHMLRTRKFNEVATARALETIERNARLQTQLIEDLLDVSRIIRGKLSLNIRSINLVTVIEAAINTVRPAADAKGIQIDTQLWSNRVDREFKGDKGQKVLCTNATSYELSTSTAGLISGDADRLQQVIWNLLSNAIKFTPQGGRVTIQLDSVDAPDDRLYTQIQVIDTGKGINPDFLPHVFDHFRQADSTTTRSYGGLGLGLAIVRHLVELHGGTVRAQSPGEGQGATFTVRLPRLEGIRNIEQENTQTEEQFGSRGTLWAQGSMGKGNASPQPLIGVRVLVVDDEADTREYLMAILNEYGAQVRGVASVNQALVELERLPPDVLVSDIGMPGEDGYSFIRQVRALKSDQGSLIPAVAVTAYARDEDRKKAIAAGFQMHISKPIEPAQLVDVVARLAGQG